MAAILDADIPRVVDRFLRMEHVSKVSAVSTELPVYSVCELASVCRVYQEGEEECEDSQPTVCVLSQHDTAFEDAFAFIDRIVDRECGTCVLWWSGECEGPSYQRMWQLMACYLVHCGWTPTQVGRFLVDVTHSSGTHAAQEAMDTVWRAKQSQSLSLSLPLS